MSGISGGARFGVGAARHVPSAGVNDLMECVWVFVFYVGGEFGMSGISGCACFVRGWGFELRGISGGVRVVHVGGELEMSGVGAFFMMETW